MFTGIIEAQAEILASADGRLTVQRPAAFNDILIGSSICVSGACLTVIAFTAASMDFDVVPETFDRTTLGSLRAGSRVNLERALPAAGRFDGHIVQGHVEGVGEVLALTQEASEGKGKVTLAIRPPADLLPLIVPKGSITVDGASLTVASVTGDAFSIALVPHTLAVTTLGKLHAGDRVNLETDILARYASSLLSHPAP